MCLRDKRSWYIYKIELIFWIGQTDPTNASGQLPYHYCFVTMIPSVGVVLVYVLHCSPIAPVIAHITGLVIQIKIVTLYSQTRVSC